MYNAANFNIAYTKPDNSTVSGSKVAIFICPSEINAVPTPAGGPFNVDHWVANYGFN